MSKTNRNKRNRNPFATNDMQCGTVALPVLIKSCRSEKERRLLTLLANNQGTLTHEIGDKFGLKSNNHHNTSQEINPRLIRMGWVIYKLPAEPERSWRWYLAPAFTALQKPIRESLRRTIHKHMEAAND